MINKLKEIGIDTKKLIIILVSLFLIIVLMLIVGYNSFFVNPEERDVNQASKQIEKSGKEVSKNATKEVENSLKKDEDIDLDDFKIASHEEVKLFIGTLDLNDNEYEFVDREFGEGTYELYTQNLLPKSSDDTLTTVIKIGQLKHKISVDKNPKVDVYYPIFNPVNKLEEYLIDMNQYVVGGSGFKTLNKKYRVGYAEAGLVSSLATGSIKSSDNIDTYFKVSFLAYPLEDTTVLDMQKDMDKLPISMGGYVLEPEYTFWKNYPFTKKDKIDKEEIPYILNSRFPKENYKHITSVSLSPDDYGLSITNTKVYAGTPIKFSYVGSVADYFDKYGKFIKDKNEYSKLPEDLTIKIGNDLKANVSMVKDKLGYLTIPSGS